MTNPDPPLAHAEVVSGADRRHAAPLDRVATQSPASASPQEQPARAGQPAPPDPLDHAWRRIQALTALVDTLTRERDAANEHAARAWSAATDEKIVGFHREMALRLSEDRDIQKHRARNAEAALTACRALVEQWRAEVAKCPACYGHYPFCPYCSMVTRHIKAVDALLAPAGAPPQERE